MIDSMGWPYDSFDCILLILIKRHIPHLNPFDFNTLKKIAWKGDRQTDKQHTVIATTRLNRPSGPIRWKGLGTDLVASWSLLQQQQQTALFTLKLDLELPNKWFNSVSFFILKKKITLKHVWHFMSQSLIRIKIHYFDTLLKKSFRFMVCILSLQESDHICHDLENESEGEGKFPSQPNINKKGF